MKHCCTYMTQHLGEGEVLIGYTARFREYYICISEECGGGHLLIHYCPWCGNKLPDSLRLRCAYEVKRMGYDNIFDKDIPEKYKTDEWWHHCPEELSTISQE